jgi:hypothetical protein
LTSEGAEMGSYFFFNVSQTRAALSSSNSFALQLFTIPKAIFLSSLMRGRKRDHTFSSTFLKLALHYYLQTILLYNQSIAHINRKYQLREGNIIKKLGLGVMHNNLFPSSIFSSITSNLTGFPPFPTVNP